MKAIVFAVASIFVVTANSDPKLGAALLQRLGRIELCLRLSVPRFAIRTSQRSLSPPICKPQSQRAYEPPLQHPLASCRGPEAGALVRLVDAHAEGWRP
jgi:hypothetical protein